MLSTLPLPRVADYGSVSAALRLAPRSGYKVGGFRLGLSQTQISAGSRTASAPSGVVGRTQA